MIDEKFVKYATLCGLPEVDAWKFLRVYCDGRLATVDDLIAACITSAEGFNASALLMANADSLKSFNEFLREEGRA